MEPSGNKREREGENKREGEGDREEERDNKQDTVTPSTMFDYLMRIGHLTNQDTSPIKTPHQSGHLTNKDNLYPHLILHKKYL